MAVSQEALTILLPLYMLEIGSTPAFAALVVGLRGGPPDIKVAATRWAAK